jgi:hypothetical protein
VLGWPCHTGHQVVFNLQGTKAPSLLALTDQEEHERLRTHMNAFFNPGNVGAVYSALRDAVLSMANGISAESAESAGGFVKVDAQNLSHHLVNTVVMKVWLQTHQSWLPNDH